MRIPAFLACLLAVGLLAAGCGGSSTSGPAPDSGDAAAVTSLSQLATAAAGASSGRFELKLAVAAQGLPDGFEISGRGAFDANGEKAQVDLDLSAFGKMLGGLLGGLGGGQTGGLDLSDPEGWKISLVSEGERAYLRVPLLDAQLQGKKWIMLDADSLSDGSTAGIDPKQLEQLSDPKQILDLLSQISGQLENRGEEEIRGEQTVHYHAAIDIAKVATLLQEKLGAQAGAAPIDVTEMVDQLRDEAGITEIPLDIWLGTDNLPRRVAVDLEITADGQQGALSLSVDMFDWGEEIDVEVPAASETVDSSALEQLAGGLFGGVGG